MSNYTVTFDEDVKGFTSFHSYIPDFMLGMNNDFFSTKDGQLYIHNDEDNVNRCNFYGVQYDSSITYVSNEFPSAVKFAKAIKLEANRAMDVEIKGYLSDEINESTSSTISQSEFKLKEGLRYAYVRRNERTDDLSAKNVYGLGVVDSVLGAVVTLTTDVPLGSIAVGDMLYSQSGVAVAEIESYSGTDITLQLAQAIAPGTFVYGTKATKIEGSSIRGYNFEVKLTDPATSRLELFASNLNLAQSFPS